MVKLEEPKIPAPPDLDKAIRHRYKAVTERTSGDKEWPKGHVQITKDDEVVYEYDRNYSFMKTFEPFRQWNGERWHNYALISPRYTTYQVLDLETYEVVAERGYPQRDWYRTDTYDQYERTFAEHPDWFEEGGYYAGKGPNDKINGEGFCAVEFYVPDWAAWDSSWEIGDDDQSMSEADWNEFASYDWKEVHTGQLGFVAGCIWGDDSSWKIRAIDLSRISEGVVTEDERFGYIELPYALSLRQAIESVGPSGVKIATSLQFRPDGKLSYWTAKGLPETETREEDDARDD